MMPGRSEADQLLDQLEEILSEDLPDPQVIAAWKAAFDEAVARAARDQHWDLVLQRASGLSARLDARVRGLQLRMAELAREDAAQDAGRRALKGYGSAARG